MRTLASFLCGLVFGSGLLVSGMTQPQKVLGFLDVLRSAGMETHATDEDVMRVFVPAGLAEQYGRAGDQQAIFVQAAKYGVQVRHLRPSVDVFAKAVGEK